MVEKEREPLVTQLIKSRSSVAVLKAKFLLLRSRIPDQLIFVFEGNEDKVVYAQWLRRIRNALSFEPFICSGKGPLLRFYDSLVNDRNNAIHLVFFFVDRDFDDLRGRPSQSKIFMTDRYSVENYIVDTSSIEEILKVELNCHGMPETRKRIREVFDQEYSRFLEVTKTLNFRIFMARRLGIEIVGGIVDNAVDEALIKAIDSGLESQNLPLAESLISLAREPLQYEIDALHLEFETLDKPSRYRGKFAYRFFRHWVRLLVLECRTRKSGLFEGVPMSPRPMEAEIVLGTLSGRSLMPSLLEAFIGQMA